MDDESGESTAKDDVIGAGRGESDVDFLPATSIKSVKYERLIGLLALMFRLL